MELFSLKKKMTKKTHGMILILVFFVLGLGLSVPMVSQLFTAPTLTETKYITIPKGYSIIQTGNLLARENIIKSPLAFRLLAQSQELSIKSGTYAFEQGQKLRTVLDRVGRADYGDVYVSVTIPEGSTNADIVDIFMQSDLTIDKPTLIELLGPKEGYAFPDTYFFLPEDDASSVAKRLQDTFDKKYAEAAQGKEWKLQDSIVTMASIIEKEAANNLEQKQIISGILWKRLDRHMRLQVDAPFLYERGKGSADLTYADLQTDSPYNTYTRGGLPPGAIGNPGYDALYAALHPIASEYLFYLHAPDGSIYYAQTYSGHLKNIKMYLR